MSKQTIQPKTAILLVNLGTPNDCTPKAVRQYLAEFLSDSRVVEIPKLLWLPLLYSLILPLRSSKSAKLYQKIWTKEGSPLLSLSKKLTKNFALSVAEDDVIVELAMRYGEPSLSKALASLQQQPIKRLIILPLYPQYASATMGSTYEKVFDIVKKWRWIPELHCISSYHDHPSYINAIATQILEHWQKNGRAQKLIFSYHGLPERSLKLGDPYYCFCHKTTRLVAEKLNLAPDDYLMVFQSRFGKAKWLEPYCDKTLMQLPEQGITSVDMICPGFAVDCLETLEEIAIQNRKIFLTAGGKDYHYIPCLNDSNLQVTLLKELIKCDNLA